MRKTIRAFVLVLALAVPAFAGNIPNGVTSTGNIPNGVTSTGNIPNGVTSTGEIPNDDATQTTLLDVLLALLSLV
ncbi:MAG TPA: hypothetical protein VN256_07295 [Pyrinomonadaceae bacterium]|nr:hypothetical protein [Pyrinomonadaceae bacterium]